MALWRAGAMPVEPKKQGLKTLVRSSPLYRALSERTVLRVRPA